MIANQINAAADEAAQNAMHAYTFAIVAGGDSRDTGQGPGTGIGIHWNGFYFILTVGHVLKETPDNFRVFPPSDSLHFMASDIATEHHKRIIPARSIDNAHVILDNHEDLALILLTKQLKPNGKKHFYDLDDSYQSHNPEPGLYGVFGYPDENRISIVKHFALRPYSTFGQIKELPEQNAPSLHLLNDPDKFLAFEYSKTRTIKPRGLSGSGLWFMANHCKQINPIWSAQPVLYGLNVNWDKKYEFLIAYNIKTILAFLHSHAPEMLSHLKLTTLIADSAFHECNLETPKRETNRDIRL